MFGIRSDGRRVKAIDPIVRFTPYIMPTRADAQNFCKVTLDYDALVKYIKEKRADGYNITFMDIVVSAFVRTLSQCPELNRFVVNKQIFARNRVSVSFVVLKSAPDGRVDESLAKIELKPESTIFEVAQKIENAIKQGRTDAQGSKTDRFANVALGIPGLATCVVWLARLLDRYGLLPAFVYDASPFHTSLFITNMASINMSYIYHHLYNFGTTSVFLALGKIERALQPLPGGQVTYKNQMPLGVVTDERICGGASYAHAFSIMRKYLSEPRLMETPPENVKTETVMLPVRESAPAQKPAAQA